MSVDKNIDESWKESVEKDKEISSCGDDCSCGCDCSSGSCHDSEEIEVNFFNYVASMGYQAMIFLGEVPNPMTNETEQNLRQAKFLIDTIALVNDKTKGNLSQQEDQFIKNTLHELQMKYVELAQKGKIL